MTKQEARKKSKAAKSGESGGSGGCGAISKKLSSQNALVTLLLLALHCAHPRPTSFHLSRYSTPSNDLGENIADIVGGCEYLSFWHGMT
jgi:hypothetical protein